ncbi:hypothetical protein PDJAM_G00086290, partial [Pangasius djambal]|nr:hypothetical protein [Pangasius djambal]
MSWAMKRIHLLSIALVLCGQINGFSVWNRTSIIDWQAGRSNVTWNQHFQLATPELLSRKGVNGNVGGGGGNSNSVMLTSEVQTAQHDSSFVQSSGGVAHGKPVLNAHSQAAPTIQHQDNYTAQSSRLYWYESLKPNNCGPSLSQSWPVKAHYAPGFQRPSSSQSAGTTNQVSGSQTQSSYQPSTTAQVSASQSASTSQAQGSYGAESSGLAKWYRILQGQTIPSSSQSVANTN